MAVWWSEGLDDDGCLRFDLCTFESGETYGARHGVEAESQHSLPVIYEGVDMWSICRTLWSARVG